MKHDEWTTEKLTVWNEMREWHESHISRNAAITLAVITAAEVGTTVQLLLLLFKLGDGVGGG